LVHVTPAEGRLSRVLCGGGSRFAAVLGCTSTTQLILLQLFKPWLLTAQSLEHTASVVLQALAHSVQYIPVETTE